MKHKTRFSQMAPLREVDGSIYSRQGIPFARKGFLAVGFICALLLATSSGPWVSPKQTLAQGEPPARQLDAPERVDVAPDSPDMVQPFSGRFPISEINSSHFGEQNPSVAYNSGFMQMYLVVWHQTNPNGTTCTVYGQFVYRDGSMCGNRFSVSPTTEISQYPDVAYNPTLDQFLVVYEKQGAGIYGQILANTGAYVGPERQIIGAAGNTYLSPAVAYSPTSGQYLVTYHRIQGTSKIIEIRTVNADGSVLPFTLSVTGLLLNASPEFPDIAYDSALNQFLVVWQQYDSDVLPTQRDVLGRIVDMTGGANLPNLAFPIFDSTDNEVRPAVAALSTPASVGGRYMVVAERLYGGTTSYIDGWAVNGNDGSRAYLLSISAYPGSMPAIAGNENTQEYLVSWIQDNFTMVGCTISDEGIINPSYGQLSGIFMTYPAVASGSLGDFLVAYEDTFASGYPYDVFGWLWGNRLFLPLVIR